MGISKGNARLLLEETNSRPFAGRILQLGRQQIMLDKSEFVSISEKNGLPFRQNFNSENVRSPLISENFLDDGSFFSMLGFSSVESMDFSADENPTIVHDLNKLIPDKLKNRYDAIYDGGTLEHVFDIRSVLRNIHEMLICGGRIIHCSPSNNHVDHGFYMFSPTFFLDYYTANKYKIFEIQLVRYSVDHNGEPWSIYDYNPGCLNSLSFGGFGSGHLWVIYVSAEKTSESTWDVIPQQSEYLRRWNDKKMLLEHSIDRSSRKTKIMTFESADQIPGKISEY